MELENRGRRLDPALTYYNQCCDLLLAVLVWIHRVTKERRIHLCRHSQPLFASVCLFVGTSSVLSSFFLTHATAAWHNFKTPVSLMLLLWFLQLFFCQLGRIERKPQ